MNHESRITDAKTPRPAERRGSVLILVVAMLVLMMLIGTAFIQAARFDRASTMELKRSGNIERVARADVQRAVDRIAEDLMTNPANRLDGNGSREPYDYAHRDVDPWLAASAPGGLGVSATNVWRNITDVSGSSTARWVGSGGTTVDSVRAEEYRPDTTHRISTLNYGDADGDGITDSRFMVSAIPVIDGVRYITAMRVIDLSGCLNINVAGAVADPTDTNPTSTSSYPTALANAPRWRYPTDLDLTRLIAQKSRVTAGNVAPTIQKLMEHRYNLSSPPTLPIAYDAGVNTRRPYWRNGPSMYGKYNGNTALPGTKYQPLGLETELLFRRRNGLNSPDMESPVAGYNNSALRLLMRDEQDLERTFRDVPGATNIPTGYFAYNLPVGSKINEMRHMLTTVSAASIYAPRSVPGLPNQAYQIDLNKSNHGLIAQRIKLIYDQNSPDLIGLANTTQFANQFAANIADYRDSDSVLTKVGAAGEERYGLERLPAVTEAFVQHNYQVQPGGMDQGGDRWQVTLVRRGGGFALEIRNPFKVDLDLSEVSLEIGGTTRKLTTDLGVSATLGVGDFVIIHGSDGAGDRDPVGSHPEVNAGANKHSWAGNPFSGDGDVEVVLKVEDDSGALVDYQRVTVDNEGPTAGPFTVNDFDHPSGNPANPPDNRWAYKHYSTIGNTDGFNMLIVADGDYARETLGVTTNFTNSTKPIAYDPNLDRMGIEDKDSATTGAPGPILSTTTNQLLIRDDPDDEVWHVGELAHIAVLGPTPSTTIAEEWAFVAGGSSDIRDVMIDFDSTDYVRAAGDYRVPHAVALLDQFTTYSPREDNQDNDGDGKADASDQEDDEIVIPGRLNINTAPEVILRYAIPMLADIPGDPLAKIVEYRDTPGTRTYRNAAPEMGIASVGELMSIMEVRQAFSFNDGTDNAATGVRIDFLPDPNDPNDPADDGVDSDREEEALLMRWLNQVCTTRSDVFAVYVNVRGYRAIENLKTGDPKPVEEMRLVAIVDRSHMAANGDKPRVLTVMRY